MVNLLTAPHFSSVKRLKGRERCVSWHRALPGFFVTKVHNRIGLTTLPFGLDTVFSPLIETWECFLLPRRLRLLGRRLAGLLALGVLRLAGLAILLAVGGKLATGSQVLAASIYLMWILDVTSPAIAVWTIGADERNHGAQGRLTWRLDWLELAMVPVALDLDAFQPILQPRIPTGQTLQPILGRADFLQSVFQPALGPPEPLLLELGRAGAGLDLRPELDHLQLEFIQIRLDLDRQLELVVQLAGDNGGQLVQAFDLQLVVAVEQLVRGHWILRDNLQFCKLGWSE